MKATLSEWGKVTGRLAPYVRNLLFCGAYLACSLYTFRTMGESWKLRGVRWEDGVSLGEDLLEACRDPLWRKLENLWDWWERRLTALSLGRGGK